LIIYSSLVRSISITIKGENMMLDANAVVLYVDNFAISSEFYQDLLGIRAEEASILNRSH
jgi:hypothetical protein